MKDNPFYYFFINYFDFAIDYISLHYPFTEEQLKENMKHLTKGDAFYPFYLQDNEQVYKPRIGLCFNQNVAWVDDLRALWVVGMWDPFNGYYQGLLSAHFEELSNYDDKMVEFGKMIPLNVLEIIPALDSIMYEQAYSLYSDEEDFTSKVIPTSPEMLNMVEYPKLSVDEIQALYEKNKTVVLINPSIWQNTLKDALDKDMVDRLLQLKKDGYYIR